MKFLSPDVLWLLAALPVLAALYLWLLHRRKKAAVRFASLDLVKAALGPGQRLRRHVPPAAFLVALAIAIVAAARPSAVVTLPSETRTIIMAIDVSLSMRAADVQPTRLQAAQEAAKAFVLEQPTDVKIGIVSFAGTAAVVQPPTHNRDDLVAAIERLQLDRHTAIGSGLIVALAALMPEEDIDLEAILFPYGNPRDRGAPVDKNARKSEKKKPAAPTAPGTYASGAIILLTDGRRTTGPDPLDAARMAAERGVRVYTVGFGTAEGASVGYEGWSIYMRFDEETLKAIADITKADYYHAASAEDLKKVYASLNSKYVLEKKETEISALFGAGAALLALVAGALSILWFNRFG